MTLLSLRKKISLTLKSPYTAWNVINDKFTDIKDNKYPRIVNLYVTERCNFACPMCHSREIYRKNSTDGDLEYSYVEKIIGESKKWSPCFQIIGGEPALYGHVADTIKLISSNNMICGLTTNGLLLDKFAEGFVDSGLDFLAVSLGGWDEGSQKKRGNVAGSFDRILNGIKQIKEYRGKKPFPLIRIATVITKYNYQHLDRIWELVSDLGVDVWAIGHYMFVTNKVLEANKAFYAQTQIGDSIMGDKIEGDSYFSGDELKIIESKLDKIKTGQRKTGKVKIDFNWSLKLSDFYSPKFPGKESKCIFPYNEVNIRCNGNIELCQGYKLGHIASDTIEDAWRGERMRYFREIFNRNKIMPACFRCCALDIKFG